MTNFVNLTPHEVKIVGKDNHGEEQFVVMEPSGDIARVDIEEEFDYSFSISHPHGDGSDAVHLSVYSVGTGEIVGLPEEKAGTIYIVSAMVAAATKRSDVMYPHPLIRNEKGQVVAAGGLAKAQ